MNECVTSIVQTVPLWYNNKCKEDTTMKQQMILSKTNEVLFEGTRAECFREMIKRNLSCVQNTKTKLFVSEEIFADFGNFYTDI